MKVKNFFVQIAVVFCCISLSIGISGCSINYTASGASYGEAKSFSVQYFQNRAPIVAPSLSQTFTENLKDRFISQTPLNLVTDLGDMNFEGEIVDYSTSPLSIQQDDSPAQNRLTITVHVKFTNSTEPKFDFDSNFSRYRDYPSSQELSQVENELIEEIVVELIDDIFNKAVVNW